MKNFDDKLLSMAVEAAENAYAPYSNFKVGAAIRTGDGKIFTGCNIENASFSLTVCAERVALFKAVSEGKTNFTEIAIFVNNEKLFPPCGACRQVLAEFNIDMKVVYASKSNTDEPIIKPLKELLPDSFNL